MKENFWASEAAPESETLDGLAYRAGLIGRDPDSARYGAATLTSKGTITDFRGRQREVLWINPPGTDLKAVDPTGFTGLFREDIVDLSKREAMSNEDIRSYLRYCMVDPLASPAPISALHHALLPARHIDQVQASAILTLANNREGHRIVREALGGKVAFLPYQRAGLLLARQIAVAARGHDAIVLAGHGLVTWGDTAEDSYSRLSRLIHVAETYLEERGRPADAPPRTDDLPAGDAIHLLLRLRGRLGRVILHCETDPHARGFVDRPDVELIAGAGPAAAESVARIRPWMCVLDGRDPHRAVDGFVERYRSTVERDASAVGRLPSVFLVPGFGVVTAGPNAADAKLTAEVATHSMEVAARALDALGSYESLSERERFDADTEQANEYDRRPAARLLEFAGRVVCVTGAASGIGRAVSRHLARAGAEIVLLDLNSEGLTETARLIVESGGAEPRCFTVDLTDEAAVETVIGEAIHAFGAIDGLVSNAGIPAAGMLTEVTVAQFRRSMEVNATSHFIVTAQVLRAMQVMGLGGSIVYVASKNAFGPGAGFGPYSVAKAAQIQLARMVALEGGKSGIRSNVVNPDAVFEDSGLWSEDLRQQRAAAHGVSVDALEDFYAQRNLLKTKISGDDVAEAVAFLLSDRSKVTTGSVIAVDGGVAAAFPR